MEVSNTVPQSVGEPVTIYDIITRLNTLCKETFTAKENGDITEFVKLTEEFVENDLIHMIGDLDSIAKAYHHVINAMANRVPTVTTEKKGTPTVIQWEGRRYILDHATQGRAK